MLGVTACIRKWKGIFWDLWACVRLGQVLIDSMIYLLNTDAVESINRTLVMYGV